MRLDKKELLKDLVWSLALMAGILFYDARRFGQPRPGDALFLSGLFALCIGLYRLVRRLGLFDSTVYSMKRLFLLTKEPLHDYLDSHPYTQRYGELLLVGAGLMALSFLF